MGYPWYSERKGNAGKNGQFKISLEKNCETKEIRFVATLIDSSKRTGKKSMSSLDIADLYNKVETYLTKMESQQNGLLEDITEIFNIYGLTIQTEETTEQIEETVTLQEEPKEEVIIVNNETVKTTNENKQSFFKVSKETEIIIVRGYMGKVEEIKAQKINHPELELYLYKSSKFYEVYEKKTGKTLVSPKNTKKEVMKILEKTLNNYYDKLKELIETTIEKDGYITDYKIGSWIKSA
jgi:hypothetical protein